MKGASPFRPGLPRRVSRRAFASSLGATAASCVVPRLQARAADVPPPAQVADDVRREFLHGWHGYRQFAWGRDEVRPASRKPNDFFIQGQTFGLSMIEALDTLYVMELDDELGPPLDWLRANLTFDIDGDIQVFEAIIRMVGGLLAGYAAIGEHFLLERARDLADRLLPAFTRSPTGAPYRFVNLRTGAVRDAHSNLAEIGSNLLEFGELSRLTGSAAYRDASMKAYRAAIGRRSALNLLGTDFDVETGAWLGDVSVAPNRSADSFYEYLWGGYRLFGDEQLRRWYRMLTDAILAHQSDRFGGHLWFRHVDFKTGAPADRRQTELAAFYAGLLAKGGDREPGVAYFDTWTSVAEHYGLPPEELDYAAGTVIDARYWLRPEYANSAFDLWRLTHEDRYRAAAYAHFQALRAHCRISGGYTVLLDVTSSPMKTGDLTPGYWFAENMKYLYLTFATTARFDDATGYLSTEGKILRGFRAPAP
jgi:mannosyl-oligosaccharide alpha-1,2-mannosidase